MFPQRRCLFICYSLLTKLLHSQEGGWPCAPTPLGTVQLDRAQGGNMGNQTSLYITSGSGGTESFKPTFSYYGVRYAALTGLPADYTPTDKTLTALRVNTLVPRTGSVTFNASLEVLNKIQKVEAAADLHTLHCV